MNKKELYLWAKKGMMIFRCFPVSATAAATVIGEGIEQFGFDCNHGVELPDSTSRAALKEALSHRDDAQALGNAIVAKWESESATAVLRNLDGARRLLWFVCVFGRILELTDSHGDYIYCEVTFTEPGRRYTYIADGTVSEGDTVVVPVGRAYEEKLATVKSVHRYTASDAPIPPSKLKHVIRKAG